MTKRVVVQMSDDCHKVLKAYAAFYDMTMSEVLYGCTRMQLHNQLDTCEFVEDVFKKLSIAQDKRALKPCFSYLCFSCKHATACRAGIYEGVVELTGPCIDHNLVTQWGQDKITAMQEESGATSQFQAKPLSLNTGSINSHVKPQHMHAKNQHQQQRNGQSTAVNTLKKLSK